MDKELKLCVCCKHCGYDEAVYYSEHTRDEACFTCAKNNFNIETDIDGLAGWALRAMTCKDYGLKNEIKKEMESINENTCQCHERDSSYVCEYCYSKGLRGHMQE